MLHGVVDEVSQRNLAIAVSGLIGGGRDCANYSVEEMFGVGETIESMPIKIFTGKYKIRAVVAALIVAVALPGCAVLRHSSNPPVDQKITADVAT